VQPNKKKAIQKFIPGGDDVILCFLLYRSRERASSSQLLAQGAIRGGYAVRCATHRTARPPTTYGLAIGQSEDSTSAQGSPNLFEIKSDWTGGKRSLLFIRFLLSISWVPFAFCRRVWRLLGSCSVFRRWMTIQYKSSWGFLIGDWRDELKTSAGDLTVMI